MWEKAVAEAKRGELRLELAEKLVALLLHEGERWNGKIDAYEWQRTQLVGDAAMTVVSVRNAIS